VSRKAAWISCLGQFKGQAADGFFAVLDDDLVGAGLDGGCRVAEGDGAAGGGLQFERGGFEHMGQRQRAGVAGLAQRAHAGKSARTRGSKPGRPAMLHSTAVQATMASSAVWRLQRLGPRRARMRDTSIIRHSRRF
jgi:hypothetical protein